MEKRAEHFTIGRITINKDGEWGIVWWGQHAEQGGLNFTEGNCYSTDIKTLLELAAVNMTTCKDIYLETLKEKHHAKV